MSKDKMPTPKSVIRSFYIKGVKFEISLDEYVSIRKHQRDFSMEEHLFQTRALEMPEYTSTIRDSSSLRYELESFIGVACQ